VSIRRTIARNTAFNALGRLWEFIVGLVLARVIVEFIGVGELGLWALVGPFLGYMALLDIGIGSGFAKYIAEHAAREEDHELSAVVSTGFFYYALFGAIIVAVGWPLVAVAMAMAGEAFGIGAERQSDLRFLFQWGLVLLAASNCITAFTAIQTGLQRMGVTNILSFAVSLIKITATVGFLASGFGVRGLLLAEGLSTGAFALASIVLAFSLRPSLRVSPRRVSWSVFRRLFGFGWKAQVAHLSNLIMFQTDKIVVGLYYAALGMRSHVTPQIGYYELGVNMANKMRQGPAVLTSALLPAASHLDAQDDQDRLQQMYFRSTKYLAMIAVPLALFTAAAAGLIMRAWMGEGFDRSAWVLRIIAIGYIANIVPGAGVSIVLGQGRSDLIMKAGLISMASNLALTVAFVLAFGFWGIPLATASSMVLSWLWFAGAVRGELGMGMGAILKRAMFWPAAASLPAVLPAVLLDPTGAANATFIVNFTLLITAAAAFVLCYAIVLQRMPFLDTKDEQLLESSLPLHRIPGARAWLKRAARV
jgi:O-antigen/teichoic acid export membrane protein